MNITAIIVDDEPYARDDISELLLAHQNVRVVGEAATLDEARALLILYKPDLVFLDVQLLGGNGFELVPDIPPTTEVIFVTSFEQYAVRAFEINALDYLLKPVSDERLASSIYRIQNKKTHENKCEKLTDNLRHSPPFNCDDRILIKTEKEQRFVMISEITAITSIGGNYTKVHLKDNTSIISHKTFKTWEQLLPESVFLRIHRMVIVNLNDIDRISLDIYGGHQVHLLGYEHAFSASRRMLPKLKARIEEQSVS